MTGVVLQTQADAPAGLLEPWAASRGLALEVVRVDRGEPLPDPREVGFAVALGSDQSVVDCGRRWIKHELAWLREADAAGLPVLGICFGAQALAAVLGARVFRLPEPEIGWIDVESGDAGIAAGPWVAWHEDGFELPPGAARLAANAYGVQAFSHGRHLAVQFHPEATAEIAAGWDEEGRYGFSAEPAEAAVVAADRLFDAFAARL
ncbi:type 1 glutamine amidotransferase [Candidatus Solirubrobacter pratensis]|uniref:type 1 glutamine amidotransferase n=1 Tax=Candidatus Solirubrobacter pratensis TaxID=1298857 RepID=UPI0006848E14|nr:type 1 glutamine amidotransferase [Candidatus Solirubrobacter pratensis]